MVDVDVVGQDFFDVKVVAELEGHHGIVDFLALYLVDVFARFEVAVLAVIRHAASGDDGAQVESLADCLAGWLL